MGGTPLVSESFIVTLLGHPNRILGTFVTDRDGLLHLGSYPVTARLQLQYAGSRHVSASNRIHQIQASSICPSGWIGIALGETTAPAQDWTWLLLGGAALIGLATVRMVWLPGGGEDRGVEAIVKALKKQ